MSNKPLIIIPARMDSQRLHGKPLVEINGKPLIQYTYWKARRTGFKVVVVTPDNAIAKVCEGFEAPCYIIDDKSRNGTARCASLIEKMKWKPSIVINWQCDEPGAEPQSVNCIVEMMLLKTEARKDLEIATLVSYPPNDEDRLEGVVYVAWENGECHWFSRELVAGGMVHVGVYVFTLKALKKAVSLPPSRLGNLASLEQLPWIQARMKMQGLITDPCISINTQYDLDRFKKEMKNKL